MKVDKKYAKLAIKNATAFAGLSFIVLLIFRDQITGMTPLIALGYALVSFLGEFPVIYLSFKNHWTDGELFSVKRLYLPLLSFVVLTFISFPFSAIAFGYNPIDYFVLNGAINSAKILAHLQYVLLGVIIVFTIQMVGASNEREIIINLSPRDIRKQTEEAPSAPTAKTVSLQGNTKNSSFELDVNRLLYVEADANYLKLVYFDGKVQSATLRMTLKHLEETLADYPEVVRCHRAFIVNIHNVSYLENNSVKGEVFFNVFQGSVPVSKTYLENVSAKLQEGR